MNICAQSVFYCAAMLMGCVAPASKEASGEGGDGEDAQRCPVSAGSLQAETPVPGWPGSVVDMLADLSGAVDCAWSGSHGVSEANPTVLEMVHGGGEVSLGEYGGEAGPQGDCLAGVSFRSDFTIASEAVSLVFSTGASIHRDSSGVFFFSSTDSDLAADLLSVESSLTGNQNVVGAWQEMSFTGALDPASGRWQMVLEGTLESGEAWHLRGTCED